MFAFEFRRGRSGKMKPSQRQSRGKVDLRRNRPSLEGLESRLVLTTSTWSGATSALWSVAGNWDSAPVNGNDLLFPGAVQNFANTNDPSSNVSAVNSISLTAGGYSIDGQALTITSGIASSQASGTNTFLFPLTLTTANTVNVANSGANLDLSGAITSASGLDKTGAGTLVLSGTNAYTAGTTVDGGTLTVDGALDGSIVLVNTNATLNGTGSLGGLNDNGGTVSPGDGGPGILAVNGTTTFANGSVYSVAINGVSPGVGGYSQLTSTGAISLTGVSLNASLGFSPSGNQAFTIIKNTSGSPISGTFAGLAEGADVSIGGQTFQITYHGGSGNDVVLTHLLDSTTTLSSSNLAPVYGETFTLTATVSTTGGGPAPTGSVTFADSHGTLGIASLNNGIATLDVSLQTIGADTITASYQGSNVNAPSISAGLGVTVGQSGVNVSVTPAPTVAVFGQSVTLTANVAAASPGSGLPTGTVQFFADSTSLGTATLSAGTASISTSTLPIGTSQITVSYQGDTNFLAGTSSQSPVSVGQSNVNVTMSATPNPSNLGQSVTFTASVVPASPGSGTPTGLVQFFQGATLLGSASVVSGQASLATTALTGGSLTLSAKYEGDTNFAGGTSANYSQTVNQASSNTVLTVSPGTAVYGQPVTLTATVTSTASGTPTPTGTVQFKSGSTVLGSGTLNNGVLSLPLTTLPLGSSSIIAVYEGDSNYITSTSGAQTVQVNQATTLTTLTLSPSPSVIGQSVTLTANVSAASPATGTPTGTVQFYQGTTLLSSVNLSAGAATYVASNLPLGQVTLTAKYLGDTNNQASNSADVTTTVNQAGTTVTVTSTNDTPNAYNTVTLNATVTPTAGTGSATGTVTFFANGNAIATVPVNSGAASFTLRTLPIGTTTVTASYSGDANNQAATSSALSMTVGTSTQRFINQVFELALSRTVDLQSMLFWENRMAAGMSTSRVASLISNTPEARANSVAQQYQLYLHRAATVKEIAAGAPTAFSARFGAKPQVLGSQDFYKGPGGGTTNGYVTALGNAILGTPFDAKTEAALTASLRRGTALPTVAFQALNTTASKQALVTQSYQVILGRAPSTSELSTAVKNLSKPNGTLHQLNLTLITSSEFYSYATA